MTYYWYYFSLIFVNLALLANVTQSVCTFLKPCVWITATYIKVFHMDTLNISHVEHIDIHNIKMY